MLTLVTPGSSAQWGNMGCQTVLFIQWLAQCSICEEMISIENQNFDNNHAPSKCLNFSCQPETLKNRTYLKTEIFFKIDEFKDMNPIFPSVPWLLPTRVASDTHPRVLQRGERSVVLDIYYYWQDWTAASPGDKKETVSVWNNLYFTDKKGRRSTHIVVTCMKSSQRSEL